MSLFAKNIDEQQESIKQILSMLASSNNGIKQFKVNYSINNSSSEICCFNKKAHSMPPWMDDKPTNIAETPRPNNGTIACGTTALCANKATVVAGPLPSPSMSGDTSKGIATHRVGKPPHKYDTPPSDSNKSPAKKLSSRNLPINP
jgi:hypothetical protein